MPRARVSPDPPDGLLYRPELLTSDEERELLDKIEHLEFQEIVMKGVVARRTAVRYGLGYDYDRRVPTEGAAPMPEWLLPTRDRAAELAGVPSEQLVQALVQRYPEGAPIGWHRDSPAYELVAGVSLLSPARLRLRRGSREDRVQWEVALEPRSGYVLAGAARWQWEHHVPPAKSLRYSITFRSLRADR
jgi:alkylated DNA repair protein (DNA oxidative demethylase)